MIDKEHLLYELERMFEDAKTKYLENDLDPFYSGVCSALKVAIDSVKGQVEKFEWINADIVPVGYGYVLLYFVNFSNPVIGRYEEDEDGGGNYYIGDENEPCSSQELYVNAWMPLPEPYKE